MVAETVLTLVLALGALARLTRLFTADQITEPVRDAADRLGAVGYLISCDWCLSVWLSFPVVGSAYWWGPWQGIEAWWIIPAGALTGSYLTGWLAALEPEPKGS